MELRNCPRCGRLFSYDGTHNLCAVCREEEEDDYTKVKNFLWDNPHATIEEVHEETEVERDTIIKFIKDGRLIADGLEIEYTLKCERCGAPISEGRFCNKCKQELLSGFDPKSNTKDIEDEEKGKKGSDEMFIVDRIKKKKDKKQ